MIYPYTVDVAALVVTLVSNPYWSTRTALPNLRKLRIVSKLASKSQIFHNHILFQYYLIIFNPISLF